MDQGSKILYSTTWRNENNNEPIILWTCLAIIQKIEISITMAFKVEHRNHQIDANERKEDSHFITYIHT